MTEQKDEIRLKELLSVFGEDRQKEIIEILHRDQIRYHKEQLALYGVSSSLLEIDLIDWDYNCGDGCCYNSGQDITLNGEKLDEQNAEDSKNALTAILTKLGYKVYINYR